MDVTTRDAVREHLLVDERMQHTADLMDKISHCISELVNVQRLVAAMDETCTEPTWATMIVAALGQSKRNPRPAAILDAQLTAARDIAVKLARANGCTWDQIGDALGEAGSHLSARYATR